MPSEISSPIFARSVVGNQRATAAVWLRSRLTSEPSIT